MKNISLSIAITSLFISQLFSLQIVNAAEKNFPVKIVSETTTVKLSRVDVKNENQQLVLTGRVKRRSPNTHVVPGHIDVLVNGELYNNLRYSPGRLHKRSVFGSKFNLVLPANLPKGSTIKLKWHRNQSTNHSISAALPMQKIMI